ncbi:hypothetical protein QM543_10095 [Pantoea eucrina]|uniref:hypothetical protein n=1 Tax=Pantoea eucrina TaxID=472693 RepID=UPI0024B873BF|nr:hypothetical protein [Pantoea eucrina]MDJ0023635.1 hypothetical protein [Pantoea eucrina]
MGTFARVKWQAKGDFTAPVKYIAELSFERMDSVIYGQKTNTEDNNKNYRYFVKIDACHSTPDGLEQFQLYADEYETLPDALAFFKNLGRATRAVPYDGYDASFFRDGLYDK